MEADRAIFWGRGKLSHRPHGYKYVARCSGYVTLEACNLQMPNHAAVSVQQAELVERRPKCVVYWLDPKGPPCARKPHRGFGEFAIHGHCGTRSWIRNVE